MSGQPASDRAARLPAAAAKPLVRSAAGLTVDAAIDALPRLLDVVDRVCHASGAEADVAFDVRLAVDEVCSNLIAHGYRGLAPGPIVLSVEAQPDRVVVQIADRGRRFDLRSLPAPDLHAPLEARPVGGLGCHLVRSVVDDIDYRTDPGGENRLTLVRRVGTKR
ncbi:MAG: ATP-binding protein [Proteobacteria bacterium]|jgi:anti-sigma regulatory factor (Ser/Thr protein kinase)|nr:ATP-binding protein [Pseudomonadota bacterium]